MKLRVLGCSGGELGAHRATSFLLDGRIALDAGALNAALTLPELEAIEHVVVTHAHLDHVKDVPLLADLLVARGGPPLLIHATPGAERTLRRHLFNGELWPDFTRLPDPARPVLRIVPFRPGEPFALGEYRLLPVTVNHPVDAVGLVVSRGGRAFALSGDTGPTDALWAAARATTGLASALVETSFPSRLQALADVSGHLTPATLRRELAKLGEPRPAVLLHHLKPALRAEIREELSALAIPGVRVLEEGEVVEL